MTKKKFAVKKLLAVMLLVAFSVTMLQMVAPTASAAVDFSTITGDDIDNFSTGEWLGIYMCRGYLGSKSSVVLPTQDAAGNTITVVDGQAFKNTTLEAVVIPEGYTDVYNYAFAESTALKAVSLPSTLKTVGEGAFGWGVLEEVVIPEGVESLANAAFWCESMTKATIMSDTVTFGDMVFHENTVIVAAEGSTAQAYAEANGLTFQVYGSDTGNTGSGDGSSDNTGSGDGSSDNTGSDDEGSDVDFSTIPDDDIANFTTGEWLGNYLLKGYQGDLTSVRLPVQDAAGNAITVVDGQAFKYTTLEAIVIPEGYTDISGYAFAESTALKAVSLPSTLKTVGEGAFGWGVLEEVVIPEGVESLANASFWCETMTKATIMSSTVTFGEMVFHDNTVIVAPLGSTAQAYAEANGLTFEELVVSTATAEDIVAAMGEYMDAAVITDDTTVPELKAALAAVAAELDATATVEWVNPLMKITAVVGVQGYYDGAPGSVTGTVKVTLKGASAEYAVNKTYAQDVISTEGMTVSSDEDWDIDDGSFGEVGEVYEYLGDPVDILVFPKDTTKINDLVRDSVHASQAKIVVIPEGPTSLGMIFGRIANGAEEEAMQTLQAVILPDSLCEFGTDYSRGALFSGGLQFSGCGSLRTVRLSPKTELIPTGMFENCHSLRAIEMPSSLKVIAGWTFIGSAINDVVIPATVEIIAETAFQSCENVHQVFMLNGDTALSFYPTNPTNDFRNYIFAHGVCDTIPVVYAPADSRAYQEASKHQGSHTAEVINLSADQVAVIFDSLLANGAIVAEAGAEADTFLALTKKIAAVAGMEAAWKDGNTVEEGVLSGAVAFTKGDSETVCEVSCRVLNGAVDNEDDTGSGDFDGDDTGSDDTGSGDTDGGDTDGGDTGSGDTDGGDTGSGDTDGGDTGSGDSDNSDSPDTGVVSVAGLALLAGAASLAAMKLTKKRNK